MIILFIFIIKFNYNLMVKNNEITIFAEITSIKKAVVGLKNKPEQLEIYNIIDDPKKKSSYEIIPSKDKSKRKNIEKNSDNKYRVQIASIKNKEKINKIYKDYKLNFPEYFEEDFPNIEQVKIKNKGSFYRIKSFEKFSKQEAEKICLNLKKKKFDCIIVK